MSLLLYKALSALVIFMIAFAMAVPAIFKKSTPAHSESLELGDAFASGIFLGAALLHLLPDALQSFAAYPSLSNYPLPELICAAGFLILLCFERLSISFGHVNIQNTIPYLLTLTLMIHALIEGGALGVSPSFTETSFLLIAIMAHKGAESFALCLLLFKHKLPTRKVITLILAFTLMTPLGIAGGSWLMSNHGNHLLAGIFNAFAAGTFLYISTLHHGHFHEHGAGKQGIFEYLALAAGTALMGLIALWT